MVVKRRLAIVTSHAIQYQVPLFRALTNALDLHVFFAHRQTPEQQADAGFDVEFDWDIDLFDGYSYTYLSNQAYRKQTNTYHGCDTPDIETELVSRKFDAVMTMGWYLKSYVQTLKACRRLRLPILVRGDSTLATRRSRLNRAVKRFFFPRFLQKFDGFLVVGERSRAYLRHYGVTDERMYWSPHAVDNDRFAAKAREALPVLGSVRKCLGCQSDEFLVLFVGKFTPIKRPLDVVRAVAVLNEQNIPVRGVFVGDGELKEQIRAVADQLNAPITLTGFKNQADLPAIYAAADVLVLPSMQETWGLVVNEAMACGTPVIVSSAVGCAPDLIESGATGYQFPVGDVPALVLCIRESITLSGSRRAQEALTRKMAIYSLSTAVEGIVRAANHGCKH